MGPTCQQVRKGRQEQVATTLRRLRERCETKWQDVRVSSKQPKDPLELDLVDNGLQSYLRNLGGRRSPIDAAAGLLRTPRLLKRTIARILRSWEQLHGEIDINDLIIVTILQEAAPSVLDFIALNIDSARLASTESRKRPEEVKQAWVGLLKDDTQAAAAKPLVDALGVRQLSDRVSTRLQGVQATGPNDYFQRIADGELKPGLLRDQVVLSDIDKWLKGQPSAMFDVLISDAGSDKRYVQLWEYFCGQIPDDRLDDLIKQLFEVHLATKPNHGQPSAMMACWRERNERRAPEVIGVSALSSMIRRALPVSVPLANDLYYFWASLRHGPFSDTDRRQVRRGLVEAARTTFSTPKALINAIDVPAMESKHFWSLRALIQPEDQDEPQSELSELADWRWLAPILIEAASLRPTLIWRQVARICGTVDSRVSRHNLGLHETYELQPDRIQLLFDGQSQQALEALAEVDVGEDWILIGAAKQSAEAIARSTGASDRHGERPTEK